MSKRTKSVVAVNEGGSVSGPPTGWGDLPLEVLIEIFSKMKIEVDEYGNSKSLEEKQALLNSRMVNKMWKKAVDDVLQKQTLKFWTAWRPHMSKDTTGYSHIFGTLYLEPALTTAITPLSDIRCPPFLKTKICKSPSPSKSVCITEERYVGALLTKHEHKTSSWIRKDVDAFTKFGQHLTSITFFKLFRLDILALQKILSHTPNLRAMAFQSILLNRPCHLIGNICLPPLPNLAHLKILGSYMGDPWMLWNGLPLNIWILNPYKGRLETLEIDYRYRKYKLDLDGFLNLKMLKIFMENLDCNALKLPSVTHLSLIDFPLGDLRLVKELPYLLHKSTTTLAELHIQLNPEKTADMEMSPNHDNWRFPTISQVNSLTVSYPKCAKGLEAVQRLLKMLPNMNELRLIQFDETVEDREATEDVKEAVKNHLLEMSYWTHCKMLKTISVSMKADGSNPFYTIRFPFPK